MRTVQAAAVTDREVFQESDVAEQPVSTIPDSRTPLAVYLRERSRMPGRSCKPIENFADYRGRGVAIRHEAWRR